MEIKTVGSGSTGNCYLISDGASGLVIEAGVPIERIQAACGYTLSQYAGCLITHSHGDHASHAKQMMQRGVDVYASAGTLEAIQLTGHRAHAVKAMDQFGIGTFKIKAFDVEHDAPEPLGFLIRSIVTGETLLYVTDTASLKYSFSCLEHVMIECNYEKLTLFQAVEDGRTPIESVTRLCKNHMGLETVVEIIKGMDKSKLRSIHLIHLSGRHADEAKIKRAVQEVSGVEVIIPKAEGR